MLKNISSEMGTLLFEDLGTMDYKKAWDYQEQLFSDLIKIKAEEEQNAPFGTLLFVEHPHVFTLGKSGTPENLLVNEEVLRNKGASFYRINRGGDITYHGPGQLVGYPILNLDAFHIGVREYVYRLEESVIQCLLNYNIKAERLEGASGVWLDAGIREKSRKICAIGVRASKGVTMHGFAFNVNTDLSFYQLINPCGFTDRGVTSLKKELGSEIDMERLKQHLLQSFKEVFELMA